MAEDERPLGGHTPERAKHMILRAAADINPLLCSGDRKSPPLTASLSLATP